MARMANKDVAHVLAAIASEVKDEAAKNPTCGLMAMRIALIIDDFFEDRSENMAIAYGEKLIELQGDRMFKF